mmetsp:Transcript_765/g.1152  ORF Transcript_765/g.1152 Transcript_765/m.1152 type:complete len:114 (-) Transcript_765:58-399(-)
MWLMAIHYGVFLPIRSAPISCVYICWSNQSVIAFQEYRNNLAEIRYGLAFRPSCLARPFQVRKNTRKTVLELLFYNYKNKLCGTLYNLLEAEEQMKRKNTDLKAINNSIPLYF